MAQLSAPELAAIDKSVGWPQSDLAEIVAIQLDQSGGHTDEVGWNANGRTVYDTTGTVEAPASSGWTSYDVGISQIDSVHSGEGASVYDPSFIAAMEDPVKNAAEALSLFGGPGGNDWGPWAGDAAETGTSPYATSATQAAESVSGVTRAQLDAALHPGAPATKQGGDPWSGLAKILPALGGPLTGGLLGGGLSGIEGSIVKDVLLGVGALAALGLVGAGLWRASGAKMPKVVPV